MTTPATRSRLWDDSAAAYDRHTRRYDAHRRIAGMLALAAPSRPAAVLDFGCGPGNSTRLLHRAFPGAALAGIDSSPEMIRLARQAAGSQKISYHCADLTAPGPPPGLEPGRYDLVTAVNSLFHVDDKTALLAGLTPLLTRNAAVTFSVYDTVFRPGSPLRWPLRQHREDTLMAMLTGQLRDRGHAVAGRQEDREILTEESLRGIFAAAGFSVRCAAVLRLQRPAEERLSFFSVPAVAAEVFPGIPASDVRAAATALIPAARSLPAQERSVFAFTAARTPD